MIKSIVNTLRERWIFYIGGYFLGGFLSISYAYKNNMLNAYYFFPIRLFPIVFGLVIGTAVYYGQEGKPIFYSTAKLVKYIIAMVVLFIIFNKIQQFLYVKYGVDVSSFVSIP